MSSLSVSSWKFLRGAPVGLLFQRVQGIHRPVFIYTGCPRGYSHSCKTHHPSLSMATNCDVVNKDQTFVTYISTPYLSFSCGPCFFVSFPGYIPFVSWYKRSVPHLFPSVHCLLPVVIMPGHDHSLKGLFEPESLNSETMLLTWICPVKQGETSPAEVLGRIFTKYQELLWKQGLEREYLRVGFSAPLFEDIEWPLMDSYLKRLH